MPPDLKKECHLGKRKAESSIRIGAFGERHDIGYARSGVDGRLRPQRRRLRKLRGRKRAKKSVKKSGKKSKKVPKRSSKKAKRLIQLSLDHARRLRGEASEVGLATTLHRWKELGNEGTRHHARRAR